jgi:hypothetical protein
MNEILVLNGRSFPVWFWLVSAISIPVFFWFVIGWITEFLELSIKLFSNSRQEEACEEIDRPFELEAIISGPNGSGMQTSVTVTFWGKNLSGSVDKDSFAAEIEVETEKIARSVLNLKTEEQKGHKIGPNDKLVLSKIARKYSVVMNEVTCLITYKY